MDPTRKLCSAAPETRQHFVAECSVFEIERNIFKQRMANYTAPCIDQQDPDTFTRLVLDPSAMVKPSVADECGLTQVELYTREYIHETHTKKSRLIKTYFNKLESLTKCSNMNNVISTAVHKYTSFKF